MFNRYRNTTTPVETSGSETETITTYVPTYLNGDYGPDACLPAIEGSSADYAVSTDGPNASYEEISDVLSKGRDIKPVSHIRRDLQRLPRVTYIGRTNVNWWHDGYFGPTRAAPQWIARNSVRPYFELRQWLGNSAWMQVDDGSESSLDLSVPPDRLGEIASRVVKKLENLHLSTTLYESRELPGLYRMFTKNGNLFKEFMKGDEYLRPRQHGGNFEKAIKHLSKAWKEGQLGYSFGLMPTLKDARDITREILGKNPRKRSEFSVTIRGSTTKERILQDPSRGTYRNGTLMELASNRRVDGAHVIDTRPPFNTELIKRLAQFEDRFIGANPLGLIWEVIPYSFAVDWFLSIDDVLDALWLHNQNRYLVQYWTSNKVSYRQEYSAEIATKVAGNYPTPEFSYRRLDPVTNEYARYTRIRRDPPSPLQSVRFRLGTYQTYLGIFLALGFRSGNKFR